MPRPKRKRPWRSPEEKALDIQVTYEKRLQGYTAAEVELFQLERKRKMALARAKDLGLGKAETEKLVRESQLDRRTVLRDYKQVLDAVKKGAHLAGAMLASDRLHELDAEIAKVSLVERKAWNAYEASLEGEGGVTTTMKREAIDVEASDGSGKTRRVMKPTAELRRSNGGPEADPRFLEAVLKCVELRTKLSREKYDLASRLGLASTVPEALAQFQAGSLDAIEALLQSELQNAYAVESRLLADDGGAAARVKLMLGYVASKRASLVPALVPGQGAQAQTWELRIREVNPE